MPKETNVWVGENMKSFFTEVTKAFAQYNNPNEIIHAHGPETHGNEALHSQITLINKIDGNAFKIKFNQ